MKRPPAPKNVEQLAEVLRRSQLFTEDEIRSVLDRWQRDAGDTADFARFARWLVARGYLNDHQANQLFPSNAAPTMQAVIVAPAANPRPEGTATPTPTAARPQTPSPPLEPGIDVELVDANMATLPLTVAPSDVDVEPSAAEPAVLPQPTRTPAAPEITVELVALTEKPAVTNSRPVEETSTAGLLDWTNVSLYLFLGALGLLVVEFAGWVLAHVVDWLTR